MRDDAIKDLIVYNILKYEETKEPRYKDEALAHLRGLAKTYKIQIRGNQLYGTLRFHLEGFILNEKGYIVTIPNLLKKLKIS